MGSEVNFSRKAGAVITSVDAHSPAEKAHIQVGETLLAVNGKEIFDVLDYKFHAYDMRLSLTLRSTDGKTRTVLVQKREGEELGLNFETYLMDKPKSCSNRCVFCFVDQLPCGMRKTLYFKDDDARLSFLMGNYITLTNLSDREVQRIVDLRISPVNVSVHATEPELRAKMLGVPKGAEGYAKMQQLAAGGITMNCQIVACPNLNDGAHLQRSMEDLAALYPQVATVSVVPIGITKHREGLYPLEAYTKAGAAATIEQIEAFAETCRQKFGTRVFYASDEFYLKAEQELPDDEYYENYQQLENGVGLLRLLETEFMGAVRMAEGGLSPRPFSVATGTSAAPFVRRLIDRAAEKCHTISYSVYAIENDFFGHTIDVAGLLTGQDIIAQLRGKPLGEVLFLPENCVRHGETLFLDDLTISDVERELRVPVRLVPQDGWEMFETLIEQKEETNHAEAAGSHCGPPKRGQEYVI